ncbi:NACHT domain-containing protein [Ilyonectria destructans]|nr:NACHT domain-containing protein [Ilyonectria destructans]
MGDTILGWNAMRQGDRDRQCLENLLETDPRDDKKRIQETKGGLLRDSYCWILYNDDFQRWCVDPQSQLLWIKGDPGKGKTMLLCGIIDELKKEKEPSICLSYFFCQATEARLNNATAVLRGLIYLLLEQVPSLFSHVRNKHEHTGKRVFEDSNAWEALSKILAAMLNDPSLNGAILIVDALDECKTNRHQLLDFITQPSPVKWIVSSRNLPDIGEILKSAKQTVRLDLELNTDSMNRAVGTYIGYNVDQLAHTHRYDKKERDTVNAYLTSNAGGTFLWVASVCQELAYSGSIRKRNPLARLKSFPRGLNSLYNQMLDQIDDLEDSGPCKELLAVASVVYRPITLDEVKILAESLANTDRDDLEKIIGSCGSFLTLQGGVIYFVHQSARDFLRNQASDRILPSGIAHQHDALFSRSLKALLAVLKHDVYGLNNPGVFLDHASLPILGPLAAIRYSCRINHNRLHNGDIVYNFIQKKYLHWLESLSLLRSMQEGVIAVHKLEALVLAGLLQDARRFLLSFQPAIEIAPLQVYASALVFSPEHSPIRELFQKEAPGRVWDAATGECKQTFKGHSYGVTSVVFSADGQRIAWRSGKYMAEIWDVATGKCTSGDITDFDHRMSGYGISGYGISGDGRWITKDGRSILWLPPEYQATVLTAVESTVAIGCYSGLVLVMKFF